MQMHSADKNSQELFRSIPTLQHPNEYTNFECFISRSNSKIQRKCPTIDWGTHWLVIIKSLEINFVSKGKKGMACGCMKDGENDSLLKFNTIVIELYIRRGEKECLYQSQISGSSYVESTTTPSLIFRLFGPIEIFRTHANSISIQHGKKKSKKTTFSPTKREKSETKHNIRPSVASFIIFCFFFSSTLLFCYSFALLPRQYIFIFHEVAC